MAGSGSCLHQQRKDLRDVVLVRQTELACRNSYDQDLWEMSENPVLASVEGASSGGIIPNPDVIFDLPAADHGISNDTGEILDSNGPESFTDRVTDIHMPTHRYPSPLRPRASFASGHKESPDFDQGRSTKSPVHDAHQRLEEHRREAARRAHDAKIMEISRHMASGDGGDRDDRSETAGPGQPAVRPAQTPIGVAGMTDYPDFDFEPAVRLHSRTAKSSTPYAGGSRPSSTASSASAAVQPPVGAAEPGKLAEQGTEPLPTEDVRALLDHRYPDAPVAPRDDRTSPRGRDSREPFIHVDGAVRSSTTGLHDKQTTPQLQSAERLDPVDRVERLATLPRCCATCRDFRQVGADGRGWCSNPYAFGERRMVQSDQLACRSSLGMWWMPNDDVWLERADTSHHGRPTPLLDASLKVQRSSESGRDSHA
ncbi:hypothetical protein BH23CHL1_BH23CHL1_15920 [soil metagenome]